MAIVGGIIEGCQRFDYVKVISSFWQVDLVFRTFVCCVDDAIKLFSIDYVDFHSKVLSKFFNVRQVVTIVVDFNVCLFA